MTKHKTTSILRHVLFVAVVLLAAMVCISPVAAEEVHEHDGVVFEPWSDTKSLPSDEGNYYLTTDIILEGGSYLYDTLNFCLNGHVINVSDSYEGVYGILSIFALDGGTLNLYDCDDATKHYFTREESGLWKLNEKETTSIYNVTGGVLTGLDGFMASAVGLFSETESTFNMYGGNIVGNNDTNDGTEDPYQNVGYAGVGNFGTFNMYGGTIVGNHATINAGGVYNGGTFTISGTAKIFGNTVGEGDANTLSNVYLPDGQTITIGTEGLKDGAKIGVTVQTPPEENGEPVTIAESQTDYSKYFFADDGANYKIEYDNGAVKLASGKTQYTISWMNGDTKFVDDTVVGFGEKPTAPEGTPQKTADAQYTYTFEEWTPEIVAAYSDATYTADYTKTLNKYTITWKNGSTTLKTETLEYGKVPSYSGEKPTKEDDEKYSYTFNGWEKEGATEGITAVTGEATYTAKFIETKLPTTTPDEGGSGEAEEPKTEAVQPIVPVAPVETADGETTLVTNAGDEGIKVADDKKSAEIEAKDVNDEKVATIKVSFKDEVGDDAGQTNSVTGEITEVTISYETKPAESASTGKTDEVAVQMDLTVKTVVTDLPKIDSSIQQNVVESVAEEKPNLKPVAMITASNTDAINNALAADNGKITLVFTVPKTAIKDINKIRVLHVDGNGNINEAKIIGGIVEDPTNSNNWKITAEGTSFSSYVLVEDKSVEQIKDSGSSSQGSSVWLTESQTSTETPTQTETATPTDAVPTDIPSTQPTETPESPAPILGIVAGLGFAVLALRRR